MSLRDAFRSNRLSVVVGPVKSQREVDYKLVSQFARSTKWLIGVGIFLLPFIYAEIQVFGTALDDWQNADKLFSLVGALFQTFWLIGWSVGVLIMSTVFIIMLLGRQVVLVHSGKVNTIIGVPGFGVRISIAASEIQEVTLVDPSDKSVFPKQGKQLKIITIEDHENSSFGSNHTEADLQRLQYAIEKNRHIVTNLDSISELQTVKEPSTTSAKSAPLRTISSTPVSWNSPSSLILIAANLIPLVGIVFFEWDLGATMVLYWAETAIILFYTVLKQIVLNPILGVFTSLFTVAHAGAFMVMHFLFIWSFFVQTQDGFNGGVPMSEVLSYVGALWPALLALIVSHGFSFKMNFFDQKNHAPQQKPDRDFYSRITLMHFTIIIGGGAALILGSGLFAITLLVFLKIVFDLKAHLKLHSS